MRGLLSFVLFFFAISLQAQEYRFRQYRVEQGLPSDVIKAVTEDSLGFIWIATDDGLVKYDGIKFTTYKNALRSQFAKGFIHTARGELLAFSDLDLVEIRNQIDTVIFVPVLRGERFLSDSTMSFPKSIYQDRKKKLWLGEPKSVIRFDDSKLKRYDFGEANRSSVFVRSFSFFEDNAETLFVVSYNGNVFRYFADQDTFRLQEKIRFPDEVSQVLMLDDQLMVAARAGLFMATVANAKISQPQNIFPVTGVSNLLLTNDSSIIVSTYGEDLYRVSFENGFKWENLAYNFNGTNSTYQSPQGDIWVATDKGLVVVQQNSFTLADLKSQAQFVEGISGDEKGNIFFATKETLVQLSPKAENQWERKELVHDKANYFQSLQYGEAGLWASTGWRVLLLQDGKVARSFDFADEGNFVHHLCLDSAQNVWLSQGGNRNINCITPDFRIITYHVEGIGQSEINHIEEGPDGIYAVANGIGNYIYFKAKSDSAFRNISVPVTFDVRGDFNILNATAQGDVLWLASSEGLLKFDKLKVERQNKGQDFERFPVSCVEALDDEQILFSNSFGLFRFNVHSGEYWMYDEDSGLPSNTITDHGIFISDDKRIWIGTSYGIATAKPSVADFRMTRTPYCVEAKVNGVPRRFANGLKAEFRSYITLQFSAVSFPENKINYQWKLDDGTRWNHAQNGLLSLSDVEAGEHTVHVRAKMNTGLSWSSPVSLQLTIDPPYWRKAEFIFFVILLVILIAWGSYALSSSIMSRRRLYLEEQIGQRTQELKKANEELMIRNTELDRFVYSASHDLSAPLKSILGLIRVAKLDQPDDSQKLYLDMMERSVFKLEHFIEEVVTYSRNTRMPIRFEPLDFRSFVHNLLQDHQYSPNFDQIDFEIEDQTSEAMISDATRMKIILNNLISNAIKFHWLENGRKPFVRISLQKRHEEYVVTVSDNGKGIPEEHLKRIFEMFYRATDDAQGSGLGLYILKEAVIKLDGTVEARSILDKGTEFIIHLPVPRVATPVLN
jgi:signal transduction histidine kinase/ligand-binding sensor domain-containing protein